jgi:hypothetical protein
VLNLKRDEPLSSPELRVLNLKRDEQLSSFAFKFNLRRYNVDCAIGNCCATGVTLKLHPDPVR